MLPVAGAIPHKEFDLLKSKAPSSGTEIVVVIILAQERVIQRQFSAHVKCHGQSGGKKAQEAATQLNDGLRDTLFEGHVTFSGANVGESDGRLEGRIAAKEHFVFREIYSTPCKSGSDTEVDKLNTPDTQTGQLQLKGQPTTGALTMSLDGHRLASVSTHGESRSGILAILRKRLKAIHRTATIQSGALLVVEPAHSIQATTTDASLGLRVGLLMGTDAWDTDKDLIKTCDEWNAWIDAVKGDLEKYKEKISGGQAGNPGKNVTDAINSFLDNADVFKCTNDGDLEDQKMKADLLLNKIRVIKTAATMWYEGFNLYASTVQLILFRLDEVKIPYKLINKALQMLIDGAHGAKDKEGEKKLETVKKLKEKVEKGTETLDNLKKAVKAIKDYKPTK